MKLHRVRIEGFQSVKDTKFTVDRKITVFVGANESGKSNVLLALQHFNYADKLTLEHTCHFHEFQKKGELPQIHLLFKDFTDMERQKFLRVGKLLVNYFGERIKEYQNIIREGNTNLARLKKAAMEEAQLEIDKSSRQAVRRPIRTKDYEKEEEEIRKIASEMKNKQTLYSNLVKNFQSELRSLQVVKQGNSVNDYFIYVNENPFYIDGEDLTPFKKEILEIIPKFYYFSEVDLLKGEIPIKDLVENGEKYQTEINLLKLAGIRDLNILQTEVRQSRDLALERAARTLTERIRGYWSQDESYCVELRVDEDILNIYIKDKTDALTKPEQRSPGNRWFISFYINFAAIEEESGSAILLFDDPGIYIHPRGQKDLLRFFEEISKRFQVLYTTHLPYLLNRNFPARWRLVEKFKDGTKVFDKPHKDQYKEIRESIGIYVTDTLITGEQVLVVEGVTEQIVLSGVSGIFSDNNLPHLDLNKLTIYNAQCASKTPIYAGVAKAEKRSTLVLLDSDSEGNNIKKKLLTEEYGFKENEIIQIAEVLNTPNAIFEDLIQLNHYIAAVISFYRRTRGEKWAELKVEGFKKKIEQRQSKKEESRSQMTILIDKLEKYFEHENLGDFNKVSVAREYVDILQVSKVLDRDGRLNKEFQVFEKLFIEINERFTRLESVNKEGNNEKSIS